MYGAANRNVLVESCKEMLLIILKMVIDHVAQMYGAPNKKVLEESCKKMLLIFLATGYRPCGIDVWSHQEKSARRKLQENGAAVGDLVTDIETDGAANRKVLEENWKENGAAVTDLVIDHVVYKYEATQRKVLEESFKECRRPGYRPRGIEGMALLSLTWLLILR
jgi:hypothetical protein